MNKAVLCAFTSVLVFLNFISCQSGRSTDDNWEGSIKKINGIRIIQNEGMGVTEGLLKERLKIMQVFGEEGDIDQHKYDIFSRIGWIDFDKESNIYVLDLFDEIVTKLSSSGEVLLRFGREGQGPNELQGCSHFVWVDHRLYFANLSNNRIEVFNDEGEALNPINLTGCQKRPGEIFFMDDYFYIGRKRVPKGERYQFCLFDKNFQFKKGLFPYKEEISGALDILRMISYKRISKNGFWFIFTLNNKIQFVDMNGSLIFESYRKLGWELRNPDGTIIPEYPIHGPGDVDPEGNLYVIYNDPEDWSRRNDVYKYGQDGRLHGKAFTLPIEGITMLRFDKSGNFYFSDGMSLYKAKIVVEEIDL